MAGVKLVENLASFTDAYGTNKNFKKRDKTLDKIWEEYALACIEHFKFVDKAEIIQEDYKNFSNKNNQKQGFSS